MPLGDEVLWFAWGLLLVGFAVQVVGCLMGPPQRVAAPVVMGFAAGLMLLGFSGSLAVSLVAGDEGGVLRWGTALAAFLVVVVLTRYRHVRATRLRG